MEIQNQMMIDGGQEEIKNMMKKKRSRGLHVIGVVLYMLRRRRRRSKPFNNGFWGRFADSFRQLRNDDIKTLPSSNITITPPSSSPAAMEEVAASSDDQVSEMVEVFTATSSSCSSGIAGYGSAKSLRDMDCLDEDDYDDDDDDYGNDDGGDEMIDAKAEEFIVRFYEQMRLQNQAYTERYKAKSEMMMV
ncbi:PREDICTED: uncharacterized protein LOC104713777 [Camelina sativa]|uniref:Uncharacterized protein LOC104713767 n=1 Tax=Camelina sativa TaxID=90675 RepID=A0ABM0TPC6_CAMSA|nr:PREDICTED: uncharacterized protein LOC104713767 [Camelina sativa]XP_010429285.1 PREDICTED: uncharacterized protein LOC104713777 [Camelina sativa]